MLDSDIVFRILCIIVIGLIPPVVFSIGYWACLLNFCLQDDWRAELWRKIHTPLLAVFTIALLIWIVYAMLLIRHEEGTHENPPQYNNFQEKCEYKPNA